MPGSGCKALLVVALQVRNRLCQLTVFLGQLRLMGPWDWSQGLFVANPGQFGCLKAVVCW